MMNITNFNYNSSIIRTALNNNEPYFCLKDVCNALELKDFKIERLDSKGVILNLTPTKGGNQKLNFINEPNLYRVIFRSDKQEAKQFQNFVFNEVLPTLRKTGTYTINNKLNTIATIDDDTIHNFYLSSPQYFIQPYFRWKRHNTQYLCCINDIIRLTDFDTDRNIASAINDFCKITGSKLNNTDIIEGQLTFFTDFSYIRDFLYTKKNTKYTVLKYNIERNFKKEIEKYTIQNDVDEVKEISNTNNKYITNECISLSERLKSAIECAKLLNITPCKFGRITNKLNLKTPEYGGYFKEVLSNNREVQTFKYKEKILDVVKNYLYN